MKIITAVFAAALAVPAAAQTAPAAGSAQHPHQGHHGDHGPKHEGHGDGQKHDCCCKGMAAEQKKMACCEKHGEGQGGQHSGHAPKN